MKSFLLVIAASLLLLFCASPAVADDVSVQYTVTSLGSDLWQYDYTVQGTFSANMAVQIYFTSPAYGVDMIDLKTGGPDWTTYGAGPELGSDLPGAYYIVALVDNPSMNSVFDVICQWNPGGEPGTQQFNVLDLSNGGSALLDWGLGTTEASSAVPEPTSLLQMIFAGLACLVALTIRRLI
jgi:hypothetical protein